MVHQLLTKMNYQQSVVEFDNVYNVQYKGVYTAYNLYIKKFYENFCNEGNLVRGIDSDLFHQLAEDIDKKMENSDNAISGM